MCAIAPASSSVRQISCSFADLFDFGTWGLEGGGETGSNAPPKSGRIVQQGLAYTRNEAGAILQGTVTDIRKQAFGSHILRKKALQISPLHL